MSEAANSTGLLILTQFASRALTFIGNQVILRLSTPTLLGIAVQLELVSVTVLYFARESLRVALQRQPRPEASSTDDPKIKQKNSQQLQGAINASYLVVLFGTLLCGVSFTYYVNRAPMEVISSPNFHYAVVYYIIATLLELMSEVFFVVIQQQGLFRARASAETSAAINRCLIACSVAFYTYTQADAPTVLPFAAGQLAYGITLLVQHYITARKGSKNGLYVLLPSQLRNLPATDVAFSLLPKPLLSLAFTLYAQSIFKLLLTQGDALLLSFLAPLHSQGAFALASNYGGLLARLLFQPIEESSRNIFGALLSPATATATTTTTPNQILDPSAVYAALTHLTTILHTYTLFSLPLISLLPPLLPILSPLALSSQWRTTETTALLASYVYYIPLTAINGIIDAFVTSVATPRQLHVQSLSMVVVTGLYGAAAWWFLERLQVGARGLVWANGVAMIARILWGTGFLRGWVGVHSSSQEDGESESVRNEKKQEAVKEDRGKAEPRDEARKPYTPNSFVMAALPHPATLAAAVAVWACLRLTLRGNREGLGVQYLSFVAMGGVVLLISILAMEMDFLVRLLREVVPRRLVERVPGLKGFLDGSGWEVQEEVVEVAEEDEDEDVTTKIE